MKIWQLVTFAFILVAVVGSISGSYYFYANTEVIIKEEVTNHLESVAESRAEHIETYLEQNIERLKLVTSRTTLRETLRSYNKNPNKADIDKMKKIIVDAAEPIQEFERICVIGLDGIVITSTNENFCGKNVSNKDFFLQGLEKNNIWFVEEEGTKKIFVTGPFVLDGETIGVGITVVGTNRLEEIVKDRAGFGKTGEILTAIKGEEKRVYLFERLFEREAISQDIESAKSAEPIKQALLGNEITFENTLDYRNEPVMAVSRHIETGNIGLVAKIDIAEALGKRQAQLFNVALIIIITISTGIGIVGYIISRIISKPIMNLSKKVDAITKGSLDLQLEKSRLREVQTLTNSLNRILASLKLAILKTGLSKEQVGLGEAIEAKKQAEERFKTLFETSRDSIMTLDPRILKFTSANNATLKLFGAKTGGEFCALGPRDVSPEKQPDGKPSGTKAKAMIEKAMKEGSAFFEWTHKKISGENFPATVLLTKYSLGGKEMLQATVRDVSKESKAREKLALFKKGFD
ncbi:MAG: PAS domain S-box protein, partial [Candidatus Diapherotrites archaeon]|nr:PAS domain S-box protein [Candidatus Diapherotrites archaeon]